MAEKIVGVRFRDIGKIYHFDASRFPDLKKGDYVIVDTSRGRQVGEVAQILSEEERPPGGSWKPIVRMATPRDLVLRQVWEEKEAEAIEKCRAKLIDLKISGVKIINAEYTFDGKRLTFLYSSEGDESVDLSDLKKAMNRSYPRTRVEMRQIGPRDVAKIVGGMGACGLESRCCCRFLTEFTPISIKMAKAQGVSLAPSEITGMCGRLRCCLIYEHEIYVEARKELPKRNTRVVTPVGEGHVVDINPLMKTVKVKLDDHGIYEFPHHDAQSVEELEALKRGTQSQDRSQKKQGANAISGDKGEQ
jgi:cell fate regulator YaaT (PSP1 superfamily)